MMQAISIEAYAKLNLTLEILGKRKDGYHNIASVMQQVSLADELTFTPLSTNGKTAITGALGVPLTKNLIYKAVQLIRIKAGITGNGLAITLKKRIPLGAGLAGGSADAAATLLSLNRMWKLNLPSDELMALAKNLGADVPFHIIGKTALAQGIGERLTPLSSPKLHYIIIYPDIHVSTAKAYQKIKGCSVWGKAKGMMKALQKRDVRVIASSLHNAFEQAIMSEYPVIHVAKDALTRAGALGTAMSGSGSAVFGIFIDEHAQGKAYLQLKGAYRHLWKANTRV